MEYFACRTAEKNLERRKEDTLKRFYENMFTKDELKENKSFEDIVKHFKGDSMQSLQLGLDYLIETDMRAALKEINVPILLIHGERDVICPLSAACSMAENETATLKVVSEAGHVLCVTNFEYCANEIIQFVEGYDMINKTLLQNDLTWQLYPTINMQMYKKMAHSLLSTLNRRYSANSSIRILELGCGTGYVTEQLSNLFPKAQITAIDFAESMIAVARTRQNINNVTFYCEDIERLRLEETYDVIISNATFQWLNDLKQVIRNLFRHLSIEGYYSFQHLDRKHFKNCMLRSSGRKKKKYTK